MKIIKNKFIYFIFVFIMNSTMALADCSTPTGVTGQMQWISASSKVKYCDGTNWLDTTASTGSSCSGTTAGTINYSSGILRFCNGTNWINMNYAVLNSCSGTNAGTFTWDSSAVKMKMCDGTNWYSLGTPDCSSGFRYWRFKSVPPGNDGGGISVSEVQMYVNGAWSSLSGYSVTSIGGAFSYPIGNMNNNIVEVTNANDISYVPSGNFDVYFDLSSSKTVAGVRIAPQGQANNVSYNNPLNIEILGSSDASTWTSCYSTTGISGGYPNWNPGSYRSFSW